MILPFLPVAWNLKGFFAWFLTPNGLKFLAVVAIVGIAWWQFNAYTNRIYESGVTDERKIWTDAQAAARAAKLQREAIVRSESVEIAKDTQIADQKTTAIIRKESQKSTERIRYVVREVEGKCPELPKEVEDELQKMIDLADTADQ